MSLIPTVLFDPPQKEIASLIVDSIARSSATSIVTGFATPGGLAAIAAPIKARPECLKSLVVGAATSPGFGPLAQDRCYLAPAQYIPIRDQATASVCMSCG